MAKQQIISRKIKGFIKEENGSITLLLIFLFLITAITSLVVVDVADAYLAKRQLTQITEAAAQLGSHQIDLPRYYSSGLMDSGLGYGLVPISCNSAVLYAQRYLAANSLRGNQIYMTGWSCANEKLTLNVRSEIRPLITLPNLLGTIGQRLQITSSVIATSVVR